MHSFLGSLKGLTVLYYALRRVPPASPGRQLIHLVQSPRLLTVIYCFERETLRGGGATELSEIDYERPRLF